MLSIVSKLLASRPRSQTIHLFTAVRRLVADLGIFTRHESLNYGLRSLAKSLQKQGEYGLERFCGLR
jgi:hypothetical protein